MEELIYIIDLLKEFWLGDPNMNVHIGFAWPMIAKMGMSMLGGMGGKGGGGGGGGGGMGSGMAGKTPGIQHAMKGGSAAGILQMGASLIGGRKRRTEAAKAGAEFSAARRRFEGLDTSNVYANLENTMEDLTVDTRAADFAAQQQQQALASTMGSMQGAAGGSGIAALAQAMAGQQSQNLQQASTSIGQQERQNVMAERQMAGQLQMAEAGGAAEKQVRDAQKEEMLLGMASGRKMAADQATASATAQLMGGIGQTLGVGSDRRLKKNIKLIGYSPSGLNIYIFEYIDKMFGKGIYQGVMSDEIPQHAVIKHEDGFDRVDYSKIDVQFQNINHDG